MIFPNSTIQEKVLNAPLNPGCYIYRDEAGGVLYVGKAISIRDRVKQYFSKSNDLPLKIIQMVSQISDVEFVIADSETEALVLETNLIKKYKPKYNTLMKDDKSYSWLKINMSEDFPRFEFLRDKKNEQKSIKYFGPFIDGRPIRKTIKLLREVFPYRTCNRRITEENGVIKSSNSKPCLYYFLGLCKAPCAGFIQSKEYKKDIKGVIDFISKKAEKVIQKLEIEMREKADSKDFEEAGKIRDKINDLKYITQKVSVMSNEKDFRRIKSVQKINGLLELISLIDFPNLKFNVDSDFKIECYDISNIQGTNAVGSMVVFVNGLPQKGLYRKFRIKTKKTPDDFAMMQEVLTRRFKHSKNQKNEDESFSKLPDLIVVDGGKGQLSSASEVLDALGVDIPIIGLAKKNEDIFKIISKTSGKVEFDKKVLKLETESRYLMQRIRDEAHRFGIDYHRKLRQKAQVFSVLSEIKGVGANLGVKLIKSFGSIEGVRKASREDLQQIVRNKTTVDNIQKLLSSDLSIGK